MSLCVCWSFLLDLHLLCRNFTFRFVYPLNFAVYYSWLLFCMSISPVSPFLIEKGCQLMKIVWGQRSKLAGWGDFCSHLKIEALLMEFNCWTILMFFFWQQFFLLIVLIGSLHLIATKLRGESPMVLKMPTWFQGDLIWLTACLGVLLTQICLQGVFSCHCLAKWIKCCLWVLSLWLLPCTKLDLTFFFYYSVVQELEVLFEGFPLSCTAALCQLCNVSSWDYFLQLLAQLSWIVMFWRFWVNCVILW